MKTTKKSAKKSSRVARFATMTDAVKKRIAAMVKTGKTSNEIGESLKITGPDKNDPHKPVRGIIIQLRKTGLLPKSKAKVIKMTKKAQKKVAATKKRAAKKSHKAA